MNLLIDIGNTRSKFVLSKNGDLSPIIYKKTEEINEQWLSNDFSNISKLIVSNVSKLDVTDRLKQWCLSNKVEFKAIESEKLKFGVTCGYKYPASFGVDRWLTLIAGHSLYPNNICLIVDSGTATTIDILSTTGEHLGGWILSGIEVLTSSLLANTQQIKANINSVNKLSFSNNSSDAVSQAAWSATVGMIKNAEEITKKITTLDGQNIEIIFTGGNSKQLAKLYSGNCTVIENLIFIGMQHYI